MGKKKTMEMVTAVSMMFFFSLRGNLGDTVMRVPVLKPLLNSVTFFFSKMRQGISACVSKFFGHAETGKIIFLFVVIVLDGCLA